jgi:hypothetical protein
MRRFIKLLLVLFTSFEIYSWPGDQASLSCLINQTNRIDIEEQFFSRGSFASNGKSKEENQRIAVDRVKQIARSNHDMDFRVTKLGDSLSDLVDFYGVITARQVFPNYGDSGGTFGANPIFMDSWNDYMTSGAGIIDFNSRLQFQNFGKSGNTTLSTMNLLGIKIIGDRENWDVDPTSSRCVQKRALASGAFLFEPTDAILKEQSSLRSTLMIGGNDVIQSGLAFNGWLPFLNKYQVDSSLMNVMAITDWHIENGKQIFLEGTLPILSLEAHDYYDGTLFNRKTLCRPLDDLLVDMNEVPWYAVFVPGVMTAIIKWNTHVLTELQKFLTRIYNPKPKPNVYSLGGFLETITETLNDKLDEFLEVHAEFNSNNNYALTPEQRAELKKQLYEKRNSFTNNDDVVTRVFLISSSISQACLNDRIKENMLPLYKQAYPTNVDGYPLYSDFNQTKDLPNALNFWVPDPTVYRQEGLLFKGRGYWDSIHIGPFGYQRWGTLIGSRIAQLGYNTTGNPNNIGIDVSLELNDAWGIIRKASRNVGVIGMEATPRGITVLPKNNDSYGGYYRQYTDGSGIYLKLYTSNTPGVSPTEKYRSGAIHLSSKVNSVYKSKGGAEGDFGFPVSSQMCWGPGIFCNYKLTLFEKGYIQIDETPIIGGGVTAIKVMEDVPENKWGEIPDFNSCVSTPCGNRWFAHTTLFLNPTAGKPPFKFNLVSGSLPPGFILTPTGLLYGGPVNNAQGSWTFKVRITDSKDGTLQLNYQEKTLTFTSGL